MMRGMKEDISGKFRWTVTALLNNFKKRIEQPCYSEVHTGSAIVLMNKASRGEEQ